jgi:hypothetical protein
VKQPDLERFEVFRHALFIPEFKLEVTLFHLSPFCVEPFFVFTVLDLRRIFDVCSKSFVDSERWGRGDRFDIKRF